MDKEAFLHQLESSASNKDKRLFAKTIYDLPADVIVGFTKEEFSRIIYISHQFSSQKMDRLCNYLEIKGSSFLKNALKGIDERNSYLLSKFYYNLYVSLSENNKEKTKDVLTNSAVAHGKLAEMGIDSKENLETAICLCGIARQLCPQKSKEYFVVLINEGLARIRLAELDIRRKENLETAVLFFNVIPQRIHFQIDPTMYATMLINESLARIRLAEMGIKSEENLKVALSLSSKAKNIFSKISIDYATALMSEGFVRQRLAEIGVQIKENLENTIDLYNEAAKIFPKTSADYSRLLMNEGTAREMLAETGIDRKENFERSKRLYLESISTSETLGDGWTYSIALLNLNSLLKNNFYKTGNKKYLEEWEKNLGDIEEKIKDRDIRDKEIVMARIHEIRANLLELDDKSGISEAAFEYYEAYKLTKIPFYKFMKEFCQARVGNKSFCNLVSDWKEEEKDGIFLDYYDYTAFECRLEKALESTINEEDELQLAVEKLTEIRDRTQIKIIKDRVSAYIYLLQALVDCFNNDSYKEAAENVKEGYKIFREYEDKQGQQVCEIFNNAIVKREEPDAWQEIIRNREFSSNFYRLLCEYSDRKRANLEFYMSGQLHAKMDTISEKVEQVKDISMRNEKKIDEILYEIRSGFTEIKDQIGKGFKGTDAELKRINEKIDNIEQNLNNLVRISKDIDGKEGECIREFTSQMLELMKKGDYKALKRFSEKIVQNSSSIEEIIEAAEIPEKEKAEAKSKLVDLKKIPEILKGKVKSLSAGVTENVIANLISGEIADGGAIKVVSLVSGEIIKLLIPVLSTAAFGVPIPSKVVGMLFEAMRDS